MRYVAIGHICEDVLPNGRALGGTVTYSSLTARALGWSTVAVTRARLDLDLARLRSVDCVRAADAATTTFENIYTESGRVQILHARAGTIQPGDVPPEARRADVVHLAPIAREIDEALIALFDGVFVGVTPQGWMRQWNEAGRVYPREWIEADSILKRASATVLSIDDVDGDWALVETWASIARVLVVTQGPEGCTVFVSGRPQHVPAPQVLEVDPTGAGDVFAAAFFTRLRLGEDGIEAARFANYLAARSVTRRGLSSIPTDQDVRECLARPYTTMLK